VALVQPIEALTPRIDADAWLADTAVIVGDVTLGAGANVWHGAVLRGDVGWIRVGARTNIQDLACVHLTDQLSNTDIGDDVTVGHGAIIHGATVGAGCLIGMGSIILDNAVVGREVLVAAGALIPPKMVVPDGALVMGSPARVVRTLTDAERAQGRRSAAHYLQYANQQLARWNS
jgi:carbonic anhydrase/acetyltransferase-like protein (isoleucine patch superfamily)